MSYLSYTGRLKLVAMLINFTIYRSEDSPDLPMLGVLLSVSIPLHHVNKKRNNIVPASFGLSMWNGGASEKVTNPLEDFFLLSISSFPQVIKSMNHMRLSMSIDTTRKYIDKYTEETNKKIMNWKTALEVILL